MLAINMDDVMKVLDMIKVHLIVLGVILVLAIAAMVACGKMSKGKKFLVRSQAALALFLAVVIVANLICTGPMSSMLDLISETSYLTEETTAEATRLVTEMAEEGIVLRMDFPAETEIDPSVSLTVYVAKSYETEEPEESEETGDEE